MLFGKKAPSKTRNIENKTKKKIPTVYTFKPTHSIYISENSFENTPPLNPFVRAFCCVRECVLSVCDAAVTGLHASKSKELKAKT